MPDCHILLQTVREVDIWVVGCNRLRNVQLLVVNTSVTPETMKRIQDGGMEALIIGLVTSGDARSRV